MTAKEPKMPKTSEPELEPATVEGEASLANVDDPCAPPSPQPAEKLPNSLFIAYQIGNGRIEHQFVECPFDDIETVGQAQTVIAAISQAMGNRRITPIFWKMLINQ